MADSGGAFDIGRFFQGLPPPPGPSGMPPPFGGPVPGQGPPQQHPGGMHPPYPVHGQGHPPYPPHPAQFGMSQGSFSHLQGPQQSFPQQQFAAPPGGPSAGPNQGMASGHPAFPPPPGPADAERASASIMALLRQSSSPPPVPVVQVSQGLNSQGSMSSAPAELEQQGRSINHAPSAPPAPQSVVPPSEVLSQRTPEHARSPPSAPAQPTAPIRSTSPPPVSLTALTASGSAQSNKKGTGRVLAGTHVVYDIEERMPGETQPQLEVSPITVYGSEYNLTLGRQIAVNRRYICYGLRAGTIRILNINTALRALLRGHTQRVTDLVFFAEDVHLLATAGLDGRVFVRKIIEEIGADGKLQIQERVLVELRFAVSEERLALRVAWHPRQQELLVVSCGKSVVLCEVSRLQQAAGADNVVDCDLEHPPDGVLVLGSHEGIVNDVGFSPAGDRVASAGQEGQVRVWGGEGGKQCISVLTPHAGQPVSSAGFVAAPGRSSDVVLMTAGPLNREVKLWTSAGSEGSPSSPGRWKCIQTLELVCGSAPSVDDAFFNHLQVERKSGLLLLANTKRCAFYVVHINHGNSQTVPARMDYLAEFSVTMPILSFTAISNGAADGEGTAQIYCVQTQAIQQYALNTALCLPPESEGVAAVEKEVAREVLEEQAAPIVEKHTSTPVVKALEAVASQVPTAAEPPASVKKESPPTEEEPTSVVVPTSPPPPPKPASPVAPPPPLEESRRGPLEPGMVQILQRPKTPEPGQGQREKSPVKGGRNKSPVKGKKAQEREESKKEAMPEKETAPVVDKPEVKEEVVVVKAEPGEVKKEVSEGSSLPAAGTRGVEEVKREVQEGKRTASPSKSKQPPVEVKKEVTSYRTPSPLRKAGESSTPAEETAGSTSAAGPKEAAAVPRSGNPQLLTPSQLMSMIAKASQEGPPTAPPQSSSAPARQTAAGPSKEAAGPAEEDKGTSTKGKEKQIEKKDNGGRPASADSRGKAGEWVKKEDHKGSPPGGQVVVVEAPVPSTGALPPATLAGATGTQPQPTPLAPQGPPLAEAQATGRESEGGTVPVPPSVLMAAATAATSSPLGKSRKNKNKGGNSGGLGSTGGSGELPVAVPVAVPVAESVLGAEAGASSGGNLQGAGSVPLPMGESTGAGTAGEVQSQIASMQETLQLLLSSQKELAKQLGALVSVPVAKEGKRIEASLGQRIEKMIKANTEAQFARLEEDRARREKAERERVDKVLATATAAAAAVSKELPALYDKVGEVVKKELASAAPSMTKLLQPAIKEAVAAAVAESSQKSAASKDSSSDKVEKALGAKLEAALTRQVQGQFQTTMRQALQESLRASFQSLLMPSFEASCQAMFGQIDAAFQRGMAEHTTQMQGQLSASHTSLANTLQAAVSSASETARVLRGEVLEGQRKVAAYAESAAKAAALQRAPSVSKQSNGKPLDKALSLQHVEESLDPTIELARLLAERKFEDAFNRALSLSDVAIVSWLCAQVEAERVLGVSPPLLSQGVLLSLVQQLGCDLSKDTARKLVWIREAALVLNPGDPMLAPHMRPILEQLFQNLHRQVPLVSSKAELITSLRLVIHVVNSLLTACK